MFLMRHRYVVCYDISDPKRLTRVHKKMRGFGDPVQYSVFSCDLSEKEKVIMMMDLADIINHKQDRIMIINIGPTDGRGKKVFEFIGLKEEFETRKAKII